MGLGAAALLRDYSRVSRQILMIGLCLLILVGAARGEDEDLRSLELYNGSTAETVTATRAPRPASQTAENITVVTSAEIEALNAHTLADILLVVPGIQLEMIRTPGTVTNIDIQGSGFNHVLVLVDNIPLNSLAENFPSIYLIPAQIIERVEIVKGAATTSWGSALGGVVNVITKGAQSERPFSGVVSGSVGSQTTSDGRGEVSGTLNRTGYYLSGGNLHSDGLLSNNRVNQNTVYGKLHYELPHRGSLAISSLYASNNSGQFAEDPFKADQTERQSLSNLTLRYSLTDRLVLEAAAKARVAFGEIVGKTTSDNAVVVKSDGRESSLGGSLNLSWLSDLQRISLGVDYDHARVHLVAPLLKADLLNRRADRVGIYLNDTITLGNFALTPSVRYDHTGTGGDLFNPSFGVTYALTDNSVLRGFTSRGYSLTSLNRDNSIEKVWTSQVGVESGDVPYVWLKGTLFRNDTWNIASLVVNPNFDPTDPTSSQFLSLRQRLLKQGVEVEARTVPFWDTSLSVGYTFIDARDADTGALVRMAARHTLDLGLRYQDRKNLQALVVGHYIDWKATGDQGGQYGSVIWDLHVKKRFQVDPQVWVELFGSVRNLFNGASYASSSYKNPGTWGEAGVRCGF